MIGLLRVLLTQYVTLKLLNMKKILFFIKLPPPITGATIMNKLVVESPLVKRHFEVETIKISYSNRVSELGSFSLKKFLRTLNIALKLLKSIISKNHDLIYFQISPLGIAFIRDLFFVIIMKLFRKKICFHLHGAGIKNASENRIFRRFYRFVFRDNSIICLSNLLIADIEEVYDGTPYVVNNCLKKMQITNEERTNGFKVLFLSNLSRSKGIIDLLDA